MKRKEWKEEETFSGTAEHILAIKVTFNGCPLVTRLWLGLSLASNSASPVSNAVPHVTSCLKPAAFDYDSYIAY